MQKRFIEIEPGARFMSAWTLGRKIGELLHPKPDGPQFVASLQKKSAGTGPRNYTIDDLTDADVEYLHRIWPGRDLTVDLNRAAITGEQWTAIKAIFDAAPDRPAWDLVPKWRNPEQEANSLQLSVASEHVQSMNKQIAAGAMHAYNSNLVAVDKVGGWETVIPVDEARVYLAARGIELRERNDALAIMKKMNQSLERQAAAALAEGYQPPEGPYRHVLPNGKRFFTVDEAALQIALAVHPRQFDDPNRSKVKKFFYCEPGRPSRGIFPNDKQERELEEVWLKANLPPPIFPMEEYTYDAYALAFARSELGSTWQMVADKTSLESQASRVRATTQRAQADLLRQAIADGTVVPLHPATKTPSGAAAAGDVALIRVADLVKFAARQPEPIELVEPSAATNDTSNALGLQPAPAKQAASTAARQDSTVHTLQQRRSPLDALITKARRESSDPNDRHAVFAVLQRWAESPNPPVPLVGYVDGEGIKYRVEVRDGGDGFEFLTSERLRKRAAMTRELPPSAG